MSRCCYPNEYGEVFNERHARHTARRFQRRGLRGSARDLAEAVAATGVEGQTILEVGGGIGSIQAYLLRLGASRASNVELSPHWEAPAWHMFTELSLDQQVQRRVADFIDVAGELRSADIVILHRVICCYPDWRAMLGAAIAKSDRAVAITVPVDRWWTRLPIRAGNRLLQMRRRSFRGFVHPPHLLIGALENAGFCTRVDRRGWVWRTIVAER